MTRLVPAHVLTWTLTLSAEGYTTFTLQDTEGRRWGWVINAGSSGWTAHLGDWGQAPSDPPPVTSRVDHFPTPAAARDQVEIWLAEQWKAGVRTLTG